MTSSFRKLALASKSTVGLGFLALAAAQADTIQVGIILDESGSCRLHNPSCPAR